MKNQITFFFILLSLTGSLYPFAAAVTEYKKPAYEITFGLPAQKQQSLKKLNLLVQSYQASYGLCAKDYAFYRNKDLQAYLFAQVQNLFLLNHGNKVERIRAFNAIAFGNHPPQLHAMHESLQKVLQAKCNDEGKFINLDHDDHLTACIYQALKETLPHKVYLEVLQLLNDKTSIEILEAEQSYTIWGYWWNMFWEKLNRLLNNVTKRSSCTWYQIRNNFYNQQLKELIDYIDNKAFVAAQTIALQDPLFAEIFETCCQSFIKEQQEKTIETVATEQLDLLLSNAPPDEKFENEPLRVPNFCSQHYHLSLQGEKLLHTFGINPNNFKTCYGNQVQQAVHQEHLQIIDTSAGLYFLPRQQLTIKNIIEDTIKFVDIARQYNQAGYLKKATSVTDCCWAFLDCAQRIAKGVGKGLFKGASNYANYALDHPIEALARPILGNYILAYQLAKITLEMADVARIGIGTLAGDEHATQEWQQLCTIISAVKEALAEKCSTMNLEEWATEITALATETILDYKCAKALGNFYQKGERKTLEMIGKLNNNLPPPPLPIFALTPEGFEIGISAQAAAIATGNEGFILAKLEHYGGGNSLFASLEKSLGKSGENEKIKDENIEWTNYGFKHVPKKDMPWKQIVKNTKMGPAKYKPEINIEKLEKYVWSYGIPVKNGKSWKVMKLDYVTGAKNGIETTCVRVEKTMNTIHGHPITLEEFKKYIK